VKASKQYFCSSEIVNSHTFCMITLT